MLVRLKWLGPSKTQIGLFSRRLFSNKPFDFEDFVFRKQRKGSEGFENPNHQEQQTINEKTHKSEKLNHRAAEYFVSKYSALINAYKEDMDYFKLKADFPMNDLRTKYLKLGIIVLK